MKTIQERTDEIGKALDIQTPLGKAALGVFLEAAIVLDTKNRDYGPGNISAFGEKGVIVRLNDKVERLKTLVWGGHSPQHEKVEDTWLDTANYGIIGLLCHRGIWPTDKTLEKASTGGPEKSFEGLRRDNSACASPDPRTGESLGSNFLKIKDDTERKWAARAYLLSEEIFRPPYIAARPIIQLILDEMNKAKGHYMSTPASKRWFNAANVFANAITNARANDAVMIDGEPEFYKLEVINRAKEVRKELHPIFKFRGAIVIDEKEVLP